MAETERRANLALSFQEMLTAIVRLRFNRQNVPSADAFRAHMREAVRMASQDGVQKGYQIEDVKLAAFAAVAFLDESVLASNNPIFATWSRMPFQEELFGGHTAGEMFFQQVQQLLARRDSAETADIIEVFYLCLLLGYRGRYGVGGGGELRAIMESMRDKIRRARGANQPISPHWVVPAEAPVRRRSDPWVRRLAVALIVTASVTTLTYAACQLSLLSTSSDLHRLAP
ncbi:MAG TPA: DotU family type IV/VI secretion system protein [Terriglobales bacterium]|nr:DotU family type IV/VI secretion system protein [Terriglobales bacterium]